jgi:hypothetical protein
MLGCRRLIPLILILPLFFGTGTAMGQMRTTDSEPPAETPKKPITPPAWEQKELPLQEQKESPVRDAKEKPVQEEEGQPPPKTGAPKQSGAPKQPTTKSKIKRGQGVTPKKKSWGFDSETDTSGSPLGPSVGPAIGPQGSGYPDRDSRSNPFKDKDKK